MCLSPARTVTARGSIAWAVRLQRALRTAPAQELKKSPGSRAFDLR